VDSDGGRQRTAMYAGAVDHEKGCGPGGTVRSFDNKSSSRAAVPSEPLLREPYHNDEFAFLQSVADHDLKIPVTGAYTIAVWSYDEHFAPQTGRIGAGHGRNEELSARREFAHDLARNVIRPN